jgi:hypothetical protein
VGLGEIRADEFFTTLVLEEEREKQEQERLGAGGNRGS